ncbi:Mariner Mos1 transposase [Eumeta japonica]|uniref:Mariner Mos1 transposase n=1 Tax=Eumeta variegata TaxID=151549 RepID=A0A4C1UR20_EUMVA|nr:Mariner Mos1 transposase [Eumeta japonica]
MLQRNETVPFMKRFITGDEKWINYNKNDHGEKASKRTIGKAGLTHNKLMVFVWWDWKAIIHYELLPSGKTINSGLYCQQVMRLQERSKEKKAGIDEQKWCDFSL